MSKLLDEARARAEKRSEYNQMVFELSQLHPRELEAIVSIQPRDIRRHCLTAVYGKGGPHRSVKMRVRFANLIAGALFWRNRLSARLT